MGQKRMLPPHPHSSCSDCHFIFCVFLSKSEISTKKKATCFWERVKNSCLFLMAFNVVTAEVCSLSLLPWNLMSGFILWHILSLCGNISGFYYIVVKYLGEGKVRCFFVRNNFCFKNFNPKFINFLQLK